MNISRFIVAAALCAVSGCASIFDKTDNVATVSNEAIASLKDIVADEIGKLNFYEASSVDISSLIRKVIVEKKIHGELSQKEKDEINRRVNEEILRLKKEKIYPAWAEYFFANIRKEAEKKMKSDEYPKAYEVVVKRPSTGNADVDALVTVLADEFLDKTLYVAWLKFETAKVDKSVAALVAAKKFLAARETAWNAPLTGVAKVDEPLRVHCIKVLRKNINPVHWPVLEKELKDIHAKYVARDADYETGIVMLNEYKLQRAYSVEIDRKLAAVVNEALRLGVDKRDAHPAFEATTKFLREAANLVDDFDAYTTNVTTRMSKEAFSPELEKYDNALKAYRASLIDYDCTEGNADTVVKAVDSVLRPLLRSLGRDAEFEKITSTDFELGITALNKRIIVLRDELIADIKSRIEKRELRKLSEKTSALCEKVIALAKQGKFDEAREFAWKGAADDPRMRQAVVAVIDGKVNPMQWGKVEKEIESKVSQFLKDRKYDQALEWLKKYPRIRTYASEIDVKLAVVGKEAEKLGLDGRKVAAVVSETESLAAIVERLVSNTDRQISANEEGQKFVSEGLTAALEEYVKALKRHDCTDVNAAKLADFVRGRLALVFEESRPKTDTSRLELGCNAFNKRLDSLCVARRADVLEAKYSSVTDNLVDRVFAAVRARQFVKAREIVKDEPLSGNPDWDVKLYALRIGLINSVINPAELRFRKAEIDKKVAAAEKDGDFAGLLKWIKEYKYVVDTFPTISKSVAAIQAAGKGFKLDDADTAEYSTMLLARIMDVLEKRPGSYKPVIDAEPLEEALAEFSKVISAQFMDETLIPHFSKRIRSEIRELYDEKFSEVLTVDLNEELKKLLMSARDRALEDSEFCDFQVALAEAAIAEQVGGAMKHGHGFMCNAVLGDYARAMRLRKKGKALDSSLYQSLLLGAIYLDSPDVFDHALANGASLDAASYRDPLKRPAVLLAIQLGRSRFVSKIKDKGASLSVVDIAGNGVVHYAVTRGDLSILRAMMDGNDIDRKNKAGETPLFIAVRKNQPALVKLLTGVEAKSNRPRANASAKNATGRSVFDVACECGSRDVLELLEKAGASYGPAQLVIAVANSRLSVARWLIAMGVDVNGPGVMAAAVGKPDVEKYLVSEGGIPESVSVRTEVKSAAVAVPKVPEREATVNGNIEFTLKEVK